MKDLAPEHVAGVCVCVGRGGWGDADLFQTCFS